MINFPLQGRCPTAVVPAHRVPWITQFYGAFQDAYQIFLVMEYCGGGDLLERLLKEGRAMSERRVIQEVAAPLLKTLQHMHSYSIIHRSSSGSAALCTGPCTTPV